MLYWAFAGLRNEDDLMTLQEADTFGKRLKYYRNLARISTYQLARLVGLTHNTVTQTELGRHMPNVPRVYSYAKALGIKPGDLFPDNWIPPERKPYTRTSPLKGTGQLVKK